MLRRSLLPASALLVVVAALWIASSGSAVSNAIEEVFVTNFPDVQTVEGKVGVVGPVHLSALRAFEGIVVPPVARHETTRIVEAGILDANGFAAVVLSLHGVVRGDVKKPGDVGVILLPAESLIQEAFNDQGVMHFTLETAARGVSTQTPYFASEQPRYTVGFPRYRVLLYNTTDKTVTANVFAYLTDGGT
jgi:hypothetical protein